MNIEDEIIGNFIAETELVGQACGLQHHDNIEQPAVDFLCHRIGYTLPDDEHVPDTELRIPVCEECAQGLVSEEWLLFYCIRCNESQWLNKNLAKMNYEEGTNIIALKQCPKCCNELLD
jgi:hypothetical protein